MNKHLWNDLTKVSWKQGPENMGVSYVVDAYHVANSHIEKERQFVLRILSTLRTPLNVRDSDAITACKAMREAIRMELESQWQQETTI